MQELIRKEMYNSLYYRVLGRQTGGRAGKSFTCMAEEDAKAAKRLCAAYFLLSGIHYWPSRRAKISLPDYLTVLRSRFIDEQQDAARYTALSEAVCGEDPGLARLFSDLAERNRRHTEQIRCLVEKF
jgi:hypothetical protein